MRSVSWMKRKKVGSATVWNSKVLHSLSRSFRKISILCQRYSKNGTFWIILKTIWDTWEPWSIFMEISMNVLTNGLKKHTEHRAENDSPRMKKLLAKIRDFKWVSAKESLMQCRVGSSTVESTRLLLTLTYWHETGRKKIYFIIFTFLAGKISGIETAVLLKLWFKTLVKNLEQGVLRTFCGLMTESFVQSGMNNGAAGHLKHIFPASAYSCGIAHLKLSDKINKDAIMVDITKHRQVQRAIFAAFF